MHTRTLRRAAAAALAAALLSAGAAAQTLDGRIPISSLPVTLGQPGSYQLTGNLTGVSGQSGITVATPDVTIDLAGFVLEGVPGSVDGIRLTGTTSGVTVRNGTVRGWGGHGLSLQLGVDCRVEDVAVEGNALFGVVLGVGGLVRGVRSTGNLVGLDVKGGSLVLGCVVSGNTASGIQLSGQGVVVQGNLCESNGSGIGAGSGSAHLLVENVSNGNGVDGISVCRGALIARNECSGNGQTTTAGVGIELRCGASFVIDNHVTGNDLGIAAFANGDNVVVRNSAQGNTTNYSPGGGNDFGPQVGSISSAGPWANVSN